MALPNIASMLDHLRSQLPALVQLLTAAMYIVGFYLIYRGIHALKQYGEMRSMMSSQTSLKEPLLYLFVGTVLIFYPSTIDMGLNTVFATNQIQGYVPDPGRSTEANQVYEDIGYVLRLIGYISFFRGWIILTYLGSQGTPPGTFGRALHHIIGGILLVNIFGFFDILKNSLGWSS